MTQRLSTTAFAKSTRPELAGVVQREALFKRLDGTPARTVAWISAPPGFGKTTLAASYLEARSYRWAWYQVDADDDDGETFFHYLAHAMRRMHAPDVDLPAFGPQHRADLAAFARRFFRALFGAALGPVALVLDNLHELAIDSPLRTIIDAGLPQVPRQCCVIVTSRTPPPVSSVHWQLAGTMVCLDADALRFSAPELAELAQLRGLVLAQDEAARLQQRAEGWAAALVLMVEHQKLGGSQPPWSAESTPSAVFAYLAGEVFERFDPTTQRLLMQLACLPRVTIDIARALSGDERVPRVLFSMAHNDYFVRELVGPDGRIFLFHPLLREFLRMRAARDLPQAVAPEALRRAALLLRDGGQADDAVSLLIECKDWPEVAALAAGQADTLLAQGRHATLAAWLDLLPQQVLVSRPDLLCAQGLALTHSSPRVARRSFEQAYQAFERGGDAAGMSRSCRGVIDALLQEFDDLTGLDAWLLAHERCTPGAGDEIHPPASILVARLWRNPGHASVAQQRFVPAVDGSARREVARATAAWLAGDFARSAAISAAIHATSAGLGGAAGVALAVSDALRHLVDGEPAAASLAVQRGQAISAHEAIHGLDAWLLLLRAAAALAQDEMDSARCDVEAVEALALRRGDRAFVHFLRAWLARSAGEPGEALRQARNAALLAAEAGLRWLECLARLTMAPLLAAAGDRIAADAQLRGAQVQLPLLGSRLPLMVAQFTQAAVALHSGDDSAALVPLQAGMGLALDLGVHHVPGLPPATMALLCATALRCGFAVDHTRLLINAGRLPPPAAALRLRRWPWAFEIATLGGFGLQRGSTAVEFSAKGPGRPVELLKVLVSMGGQNVRADLLADALWPHVDADYAHKSFTATLHRLRRIFGSDDMLRLSDGKLSLNPTQIWLDTWALEHLLEQIETCLRADDARAADTLLSGLVAELLALYRGPFLPDESEQPAYIARREQLRARVLRAVSRCARRWEETGRHHAAVDCYLRCVQADELCEAFYRNLMLCHQRHGEISEALATYGRLQVLLAARLKSTPSPETQAIHLSLRI